MAGLIPTGLSSTLHPCRIPEGKASHAANVRVDRGVLEARPGLAQLWKRPGANPADVCWGMGFARYDGSEEYVIVLQHSGSALSRVYVVGPTGVQLAAFNSDKRWTDRASSNWMFYQFGEFLYAANTTDGVWRKRVGVHTVDSWGRVNMQQVSLSDASASIGISWPTTQGYGITQQWGGGAFAGAVAFQISDSQAYPITTSAGYPIAAAVSVANGQLYGKWTNDPNVPGESKIPTRFVSSVFTFNTPYNAIDSRYWYMEATVLPITGANEGEWSDHDDGEPRFNMLVPLQCWASEDATAPANDFSDPKWRSVRVYAVGLVELPMPYADGAPHKIALTIDLDHLQFGNTGANVIDSIKKLAFRFGVVVDNDFTFTISTPLLGGSWLSKPRYWNYMDGADARSPTGWRGSLDQMEDLEYAVTDFNTGSLAESNATIYFVNRLNVVGKTSSELLLPLGSRVTVNYSAPGVAFDSTRVWRKRHSNNGEWQLIFQSAIGSGAGSFEDSRVDAVNDIKPWAALESRPESFDFGTADANTLPSAICAWRGHMVYGIGTNVYLSYLGRPAKVLAPVFDATNGGVDIDDPTVGRTLPMSYTLGDAVLALHAPSELYAVGTEGVYAMVGDSANEASPFTKLPGAFGSSGHRASCAFADGVCVACNAGLFYYQLSRLSADQQDSRAIRTELTSDVRETYAMLLAKGAPSEVVVAVLDDEIVVSRGRFVLRRDRDGNWSYHEYSSSALASGSVASGAYGVTSALPALPSLHASVSRGSGKNLYSGFDFTLPAPAASPGAGFVVWNSDTEHGSAAISRSGVLFRVDRAANGAEYTSDAGYAIPFSYTYGEQLYQPRVAVSKLSLMVEWAEAVGSVRVIAEEWDGKSGSRVVAVDKSSADSSFKVDSLNTRGGFGGVFTICGQSAASKVVMTMVEMGKTGGANAN